MTRAPVVTALMLGGACLPGPVPADPAPPRPAVVELATPPGVDAGAPICDPTDEADCRRACRAGNAESCARLGALLLERPDAASPDAVVALFERACEGGSAKGCNGVAVAYQRGIGVEPDMERAREKYTRACDGGFALSCYNLGQLHRFGESVPIDLAAAAQHYERACTAGAGQGCDALGTLYWRGEGVPQSSTTAIALFTKACHKDVAAGCFNLAVVKVTEGDRAAAQKLFARACKLGNEKACDPIPTE